ncbi:hypothetical protein ACIPL1_24605 [Pseudomonas sp. NPDC090202]|uniref:hypothetical protein n=1 Tax=unclassified Pseudomonas TaxID=196821 RepID=UPI0038141257
MKITSLIIPIVVSALCLPFCAYAATPTKSAPKVWQQEPDSFMGLRFDQKVDQVLPLCTRGNMTRTMCHDEPYYNTFRIRSGPSIGSGYGLHADAGGQGIESFYLTANSEDYVSLSQLLISKYGPPTERTAKVVKTKAGAEFNNETLLWKGSKVIIFAQKYSGDIDSSAVSITTVEASERQSAEMQRKAQEAVNKL